MITIMGATGHTGRAIAEILLAHGEKVRVLSRAEKHLAPPVQRGAEPAVGDASDQAYLINLDGLNDESIDTIIRGSATRPSTRSILRRWCECVARQRRPTARWLIALRPFGFVTLTPKRISRASLRTAGRRNGRGDRHVGPENLGGTPSRPGTRSPDCRVTRVTVGADAGRHPPPPSA